MKSEHNRLIRTPRAGLRGAALVLVLSFSVAAPLCAQTQYLPPGKPDGLALLPPPPAPGSEEEAADLAETRAVFNHRTPAEEAKAKIDAKLAFSIFAPAIGPEFDLGRLPKTEGLLRSVKADIGGIIDAPKNYWQRRRPYLLDPKLALGYPEPSYSYPSGHSTRGTVYAGVLALLFPEKQAAILAMGRQIGWDRVLIGKHYPSDVFAGRVMGKAILRVMLTDPAFQHDLAAAKAEIAAARPATTAAK